MTKEAEEKLKDYLALYGRDFSRWPITLSAAERKIAADIPEYKAAQDVDSVLEETIWPEVSSSLKARTLEKIKSMPQAEIQMPAVPLFVTMMIRKPAYLMVSLAMFLCLGVVSGNSYKISSQPSDTAYSYFAMGPAYSYSVQAGGAYGGK